MSGRAFSEFQEWRSSSEKIPLRRTQECFANQHMNASHGQSSVQRGKNHQFISDPPSSHFCTSLGLALASGGNEVTPSSGTSLYWRPPERWLLSPHYTGSFPGRVGSLFHEAPFIRVLSNRQTQSTGQSITYPHLLHLSHLPTDSPAWDFKKQREGCRWHRRSQSPECGGQNNFWLLQGTSVSLFSFLRPS